MVSLLGLWLMDNCTPCMLLCTQASQENHQIDHTLFFCQRDFIDEQNKFYVFGYVNFFFVWLLRFSLLKLAAIC